MSLDLEFLIPMLCVLAVWGQESTKEPNVTELIGEMVFTINSLKVIINNENLKTLTKLICE